VQLRGEDIAINDYGESAKSIRDEIMAKKRRLDLGTDTYTMAFKACNYACYKELDLTPRE
jgi:hypothetical protein